MSLSTPRYSPLIFNPSIVVAGGIGQTVTVINEVSVYVCISGGHTLPVSELITQTSSFTYSSVNPKRLDATSVDFIVSICPFLLSNPIIFSEPLFNPDSVVASTIVCVYSLPITINTQKNNPVKQQIIENSGTDTRPTFIGGKGKLKEYLKQNYKIPSGCQIGNVFTSFIVEEDGSLSDIKILKDMGLGSGEEAIRVLKESPKWNPATHNGKPIRVTHTLAISTNITDDPKDEIYTTSEVFEKPIYPGGMDNFFSDVAKTYKVPEKKGLNGRIYVEFIIEPDGSLTNARILKDIGYGTGEEALRCLAQLKNWIPGKLEDGTKVRTSYSLPITVITKN